MMPPPPRRKRGMDVQRALTKLDEFVDAIAEYEKAMGWDRDTGMDSRRPAYDKVTALQPLIEAIAAEAEPGVAHNFQPGAVLQFSNHRDIAIRVKGILESRAE